MSKKKNRKAKKFVIEASIQRFFPSVSRMGFSVPTPWGRANRMERKVVIPPARSAFSS